MYFAVFLLIFLSSSTTEVADYACEALNRLLCGVGSLERWQKCYIYPIWTCKEKLTVCSESLEVIESDKSAVENLSMGRGLRT